MFIIIFQELEHEEKQAVSRVALICQLPTRSIHPVFRHFSQDNTLKDYSNYKVVGK